jgi:hypothetical protein
MFYIIFICFIGRAIFAKAITEAAGRDGAWPVEQGLRGFSKIVYKCKNWT